MPVVRFNGKKLDPATIKALVAGTLVNGSKPSVWWNRQSIDFRNSFMDVMRTSARNGESLTQAITRVVGGTVDGVSVPGVMKTTKARAGALAATAQNAVSNEAALKTFQANNDVIKAISQLSTLDNRTSDICVAYSGQTWDVNTLQPIMGGSLPFNGGPPRHFNCRSRLRPVTMSFKELGVDAAEIPKGTRASMDGQVPSDITFNQFLKGKSNSFADDLLGPKRAQLWRDGDITLTQLVDMRGNSMTLRQLEELIGIKPKPKFNPATNRTVDVTKPKKKTVNSFLENDDGSFVQITQAEFDEISGYAKRLVAAADDADALVTKQIKGIADDVGAKFPDAAITKDGPLVDEGSLFWRKKDLDSTSRKIQTYARDKGITFNEAAEQISDSLRYTYVVSEENYIAAVKETMERFAELGYKNGKFDAAWFKRPDYRGLNINMVSPQGVRMELQFHTARSFEIKNGINHDLYEKFRKLSTAKQKGKEGQALQASMKANAETVPFPPNIKELDELAKIYNKPKPAAQTKILEEGAERAADAVQFAKVQEFNSVVAARITEGDLKLARSFIDEAADTISDKVKKSALARVKQVRKTAVKEADEIIKKEDFVNIASREKFNEAFLKVLDDIDEAGKSQATRLEVVDKLKTLKAANAEKFATEDLLFHQVLGNFKEAAKVAKTIENPSPKFKKLVKELKADDARSTEKRVRLALENGDSKEAIKLLVEFGDTSKIPKLKALHKEIQKGQGIIDDTVAKLVKADVDDFEAFSALVKKEINDSDIPNWMRNRILNDPKFAAAEESANFKPIVKLAEKTLIEGDLAKVKELLDSIPLQIKGRSKLSQAFMSAKQKQDDIIKIEFPKKVKEIATKEFGFTAADIELLATSVDDLAVLMKGVITDGFKDGLKASLGTARTKLREAMDKVKALNKASKGVDEITNFASTLDAAFSSHPEFQAVIKKVTKTAQKKASDARQAVINKMIQDGSLNADDIIAFGDNVLKEAMKDVNKKLGKKQLEAKIVEVKSKIANAKKGEVSVAEFAADPTKYDVIVIDLLDDWHMNQLKEAVKSFIKDGAGSSAAKSSMNQVLKGNFFSAKQTRAIKEYVHRRVNPKTLPSGANFDAKVAEIVTKHVNNVDQAVIRAHIDAMTKGADASVKLNFEQTVFTRAGVKNFDDLGVIAQGEASSNVNIIRNALKIDDPGNTPIPVHTADEQLQAAKQWLHSSKLPDDEFKRQQLQQSKSLIASSKGIVKQGDLLFGENSWGITKEAWDKWVKNVAPTLDEWDVALINQYTGGMAGRMNAGLYDGGVSFEWTAGARALNSALDKMPKHTGTVYRGTSSRSNWSADYIDARYEVGKTVTERGFGSSSTQTASQFNGNLKFIIKTNGKSAAIIGQIGQYGTAEMEVLFKAGTRFKVLKKKRQGSGITVWMEEI